MKDYNYRQVLDKILESSKSIYKNSGDLGNTLFLFTTKDIFEIPLVSHEQELIRLKVISTLRGQLEDVGKVQAVAMTSVSEIKESSTGTLMAESPIKAVAINFSDSKGNEWLYYAPIKNFLGTISFKEPVFVDLSQYTREKGDNFFSKIIPVQH